MAPLASVALAAVPWSFVDSGVGGAILGQLIVFDPALGFVARVPDALLAIERFRARSPASRRSVFGSFSRDFGPYAFASTSRSPTERNAGDAGRCAVAAEAW